MDNDSDEGGNEADEQLPQPPSMPRHKFSSDEEAAMEAAVEIAVLLSHSNSKNAETLYKSVVTDNYEKLAATAAIVRAEMSKGGAL